MRHCLLFLLIFSIAVIPAHAQEETMANNASVYSYLGFGTPVDMKSPFASGMGLIGVAISDVTRASLANPAFWGETSYTNGAAGFNFMTYDAADNFGNSQNLSFNFTHAQLVIPVMRNRLGVSIALFPETHSSFQFNIEDEITLPTADSTSVIQYNIFNRGTGGINRLELGFGVRVNDNISLGYAPSLMFGVSESVNDIIFGSNLYQRANYTTRTRYRGFGHRFGALASTHGLFNENDKVLIGATASLTSNLSAHRRVSTEFVVGNQIGETDLVPEESFGKQTVRFPFETTAGITYFPRQYLLIGAEFQYQQWSDYVDFNGNPDPYLKDRMRLALGFEYDALGRGESGFLNSFIYRLGFSYDDGHLEINNKEIQTMLFSFGLGIPTRAFGSSIDVGFDYGIRGTKDNNLVRERIFGVKLSFNLSEIMFVQRRLN